MTRPNPHLAWVVECGAIGLPLGDPSRITVLSIFDNEHDAAQELYKASQEFAARMWPIPLLADGPPGIVTEAPCEKAEGASNSAWPDEAAYPRAAPLDERAAFEKWARDQEAFDLLRNSDGDYDRSQTHFVWLTWQARALLATSAAPQPTAQEPVAVVAATRWIKWTSSEVQAATPPGTKLYTHPARSEAPAASSEDVKPQWNPEPPCWLVEKRADSRTVGFLGHELGSFEWFPTPDKATRFVRREDANGVAECFEFEDVIVAEHIWG